MDPPRVLVVVATPPERPAGSAADGFEVLVTGVGKSAAAVAATTRLAAGPRPSAVISFGVAGAYPASGLAVGDVVVATHVAAVDEGLDAGDRFVPFAGTARGFDVPGAAWTAADAALVDRLVSGPPRAFTVVAGRVATVSVCSGTARLADERGRGGVLAEGMEGAAVALAAARHGVPFAEVRGISNPCGPRDAAPFDVATAVANASAVLAALREGA